MHSHLIRQSRFFFCFGCVPEIVSHHQSVQIYQFPISSEYSRLLFDCLTSHNANHLSWYPFTFSNMLHKLHYNQRIILILPRLYLGEGQTFNHFLGFGAKLLCYTTGSQSWSWSTPYPAHFIICNQGDLSGCNWYCTVHDEPALRISARASQDLIIF